MDSQADETTTADEASLEEHEVSTTHTVKIAGEAFDYVAKVGKLILHDDEEAKPTASVFYTAYLRTDVQSARNRPLVIMWNGGPGSSSIWLHMYSFGPRRIVFDKDPLHDTSLWELRNNEYSILDTADLVFVDPPGTGFSRVAPGEDADRFHGVDADSAAIGDFITSLVFRLGMAERPIVLFGESYGTLRVPAVAEYLQRKQSGLDVDGIVLLSSLMDVAGVTSSVGTTLGDVGQLPTYAATALYHGVTTGALETVIAEAEDFALNEYASALLKGSRLTAAEERRISKRLAELTGLSPAFIEHANLRVGPWRFAKELLRERRRTVGRLDTRWVGIDSDVTRDTAEHDPSLSMITGPATRALNHYVRQDLGWEGDRALTYRHMVAFPAWRARQAEQDGIWTPQLETATLLRTALNRAPHLKVLLQSAYYDIATPYFPAELTFDHLHLDPERARNITMRRYESGHMAYLHEPTLSAMRDDLVEFLLSVRPGLTH